MSKPGLDTRYGGRIKLHKSLWFFPLKKLLMDFDTSINQIAWHKID